jgi:tetratricopeptide (TPR) repeat protein
MKLYKYIIALLLTSGILITSCDKALDFEPQGETLTAEALKNADDLQKLLNSCYDVLRGLGGRFLGGRSQIFSELMADNINGNGLSNGDFRSVYNHSTSVFGNTKSEYFGEPYQAIYRANTILANLDLANDEATRKRLEGEAKFIRAICHFDVVRLFAQPYGYTADNSHLGIPLRLQPTAGAVNRSSVKEVYDQIIKDLTEAAELIPPSNNGYATSWSAKGYLARVYFQMNNFQQAYEYANDVISNGGFILEQDLTKRFSVGGTKEDVFSIVSTSNLDNRGVGFVDNYRSDTRVPELKISEDMYRLATSDPNDKRATAWYSVRDAGQPNAVIQITKFNKDYFNVPLLHLTELKLTRAEAAGELNTNLSVAIADLNDIMARAYGAGNRSLPANTGAAQIIQTARTERRLEMVAEGDRLFQLKRIGAKGENVLIRNAPWNCDGMVLQFPQGEISSVPGFIRNPEGNCN